MSVDKEYVSTFEFGSYSNTDDADGSITRLKENSQIEESLLRDKLTRFHGEIMQVPPIYSAIRVGGQRSYKRARNGREVKLPPRSVTVDKMDLVKFSYPEATFKIKCSKGTYIRSLARDLGKACGSAGYVSQLRRTKVGSIGIDSAITVEDLQKRCNQGDADSCFTKISDVLVDIPHFHIQNKTESIKRFLNGNPIECKADKQGEHAVFDEEDKLLGIGRISMNMLHPKTIMAITV
jgi:tRNA pseudouridine55 synthase